MKIYTDDPLVHYTKSTISAERTKKEIDDLLRMYDADLITWRWKPELNDIFVMFTLEEIIDGLKVRVGVKVVCSIVWDKGVPKAHTPDRRLEQPNLIASMRLMHYYIKSHLETAYATQSSRVRAFLPDLMTANGTTFFDSMKSKLDKFSALDYKQDSPTEVEIILPKPRNITNEKVIDA